MDRASHYVKSSQYVMLRDRNVAPVFRSTLLCPYDFAAVNALRNYYRCNRCNDSGLNRAVLATVAATGQRSHHRLINTFKHARFAAELEPKP